MLVINKLIGGLLAVVVGLALMPVIADSVDALTGTGMTYENTTTGALIDLIPLVFVIVIVVGTVILVPRNRG